jgi:hypothetical protein
MSVLTFDLESIDEISTIKISVLPNNLLSEENLQLLFETLKTIVLDRPKVLEL